MRKTAFDIGRRNGVPSVRDPLGDALPRQSYVGESQIAPLHAPSCRAQRPGQSQMRARSATGWPRQSGPREG
jgi:hypothetical protein